MTSGALAILEADSTPARLVAAAERLVAERGVDGASLRAINAAAGSNVAATHYHFGSKEALISAVLDARMNEVRGHRIALLEPLESLEEPPLREVVKALVEPFARRALEEGDTYVRFLAALYAAGDPWWQLAARAFSPQHERVMPLLDRSLPAAIRPIRSFRLRTATTTLFSVLGSPRLYWPSHLPLGEVFISAVVDVFQSIISGPVWPLPPEEHDAPA